MIQLPSIGLSGSRQAVFLPIDVEVYDRLILTNQSQQPLDITAGQSRVRLQPGIADVLILSTSPNLTIDYPSATLTSITGIVSALLQIQAVRKGEALTESYPVAVPLGTPTAAIIQQTIAGAGAFSFLYTIPPGSQAVWIGMGGLAAGAINPLNVAVNDAQGNLLEPLLWPLPGGWTPVVDVNTGVVNLMFPMRSNGSQLRVFGVASAATLFSVNFLASLGSVSVRTSPDSPLAVNTTKFPWDASAYSLPAVGVQASVVLAATPGKTYTCDTMSGFLRSSAGVGDAQAITLYDGAAILTRHVLAVQALANAIDRFVPDTVSYRGTTGNSMTLQLDNIGAGSQNGVSLGAYIH